ncbi:MAG: hypothetical protein KKD44_23855 [Proteobacteria bacterium]|nr:hypothetical protein [Pseudomonadota bacterium]
MEKPTALEKRIKRHVTAREHPFFVVVSPGLLQVCKGELNHVFKGEKVLSEVDGGIEFHGSVADCYLANLHLRCASRILMRLSSFTASDFASLEKKIDQIPWELYLQGDQAFDIHVTLKKSRLYHSGAVIQRFNDRIRGREGFALNPGKQKQGKPQTLFVRAVNDRFEVSIDSSGELLYIRGLKTQGGKAPLRETLAAGMLMLAGYDGKMPLIDPMCGTGSFALEAAMMAGNIPPGWHREFAFEHWPCFRPGTWKHMRQEAEPLMGFNTTPRIFSSDQDSKACDRMTENVIRSGLESLIQVTHRDFFEIDPNSLCQEKGLILINPPYGLRLGTKKQSETLIRDLFSRFERTYGGWIVGLISPFDAKTLKPSFPVKTHVLFHGGLELFYLTGTVRGKGQGSCDPPS